jgi:hypothetical protein
MKETAVRILFRKKYTVLAVMLHVYGEGNGK